MPSAIFVAREKRGSYTVSGAIYTKGEDILRGMELSALAYRDIQPVYCDGTFEAISDPLTDVQFFLRRRDHRLYITFRGTDSPRDWKTNLMFPS